MVQKYYSVSSGRVSAISGAGPISSPFACNSCICCLSASGPTSSKSYILDICTYRARSSSSLSSCVIGLILAYF